MTNLKLPVLSPTTKIIQDFSTSTIEVTYSRPSIRGRKIFGDVVPFGKVWRTGANAATKISFGEDVELEGHTVKAGEYALYTIPGEDKWEVILNTNANARGYDAEADAVRFAVTPVTNNAQYNLLTIDITNITFTSCHILLMWDNVKVEIGVAAHNDAHIDSSIQAVINNEDAPFPQIAAYYYEKDNNHALAKTAIDKAVAQQPASFFMWHMKAKIEKRLGSNEEAINAANISTELAINTPFGEMVRNMNEAIIAGLN